MKRYFLLHILIAAVTIAQAQHGFTLKGTITGLSDDTMHLTKVYDGQVLYTTVAKNGQFVFQEKKKFVGDKVMLTGGGLKTRTQFYIEPGTITVSGDLNSVHVAGT